MQVEIEEFKVVVGAVGNSTNVSYGKLYGNDKLCVRVLIRGSERTLNNEKEMRWVLSSYRIG